MSVRFRPLLILFIALALLAPAGRGAVSLSPTEPTHQPSRTTDASVTCVGGWARAAWAGGPCAPRGVRAADGLPLSAAQSSDPTPHGRGFVPPSMDLSHLADAPRPAVAAEALPSRFDWRDRDGVSYVTPVKNQGSCGACYAFAAMADIESQLMIEGAGTTDLSENNVKECNWYATSCAGGDYRIVVDLLSKQGTVLESCDGYVAGYDSCATDCTYQHTVLDWRMVSGNSLPATETLKQTIAAHGPIYVSMYAGDEDPWADELNSYDGSGTLYYTGSGEPNHAVLIVGWDDQLEHAEGTGGWIVKNSWGMDWGDEGYFRIAYRSASIGKWASFVHDWQPYDEEGALWYYDEGGWSAYVGVDGETTAWGLARFTPDKEAVALRVELWTTDVTTDVDVYVYDDFDGNTLLGLLGQSLDHSFDEAGYHSIPLNQPVALSAGDEVIAVARVSNATFERPIAADANGSYETGRTYFSSSGSSWVDLGDALQVDAGIRLRTTAAVVPVVADFSASPTSGVAPLDVAFTNVSVGDYDTCSWDFGDGDADSSCEDPNHTYTAPGVYTVALTVSGRGGEDTLTRTDYVRVYEPVAADFVGVPTVGLAPLTVDFMNTSSGDYDTIRWTFGDGATTTVEHPSHTYAIPGVYMVTLSVEGLGGADVEEKPGYVLAAQSRVYLPLTTRDG